MTAMLVSTTIQTASIGIPDTMFLMVLALIVFGPRRLPEIGRQIGKLMYEFRKVSNEFKFQMEEELRASEEAERQKKLEAASTATPAAAQPVQFAAGEDTVPVSEQAAKADFVEQTYAEANAAHTESEPPVPGEVRAEARKWPPAIPNIQPPATGEPVAAERPFRTLAMLPREENPAPAIDAMPVTPNGNEADKVSAAHAGEPEANHA